MPRVKYLVFVPDGCADVPLDAAVMPHLAALAARGEVGRAEVIPAGLPPGSDVGNMAILGFDPARYHTGRAPIEAAAMGVALAPGEVAFRCNLVTVGEGDPETMVDFAAGHITSEQARPIVAALDAALGGGGVRFHAGVEYRHLCVLPADLADAECTPPHDLTGKPVQWPTGPAAARLRDLMDRSRPVVQEAAAEVGSSATQIWLWGQGVKPALPQFAATFGVEGRMSSAVDLVRGLGVLTGIEVVDVPGATAGFDNDYAAQRDACLASLEDRDFFLLHVEATDEAGHQGKVDVKVDALERWDRDVIGPIVDALATRGDDHRILLLPDHATPCTIMTHTSDPVPYLLYDSRTDGPGGEYSERGVADRPAVPAHTLMGRLLG
jgi:2,3-bisphosphoglycerate-independent phosphoglycerate mutase